MPGEHPISLLLRQSRKFIEQALAGPVVGFPGKYANQKMITVPKIAANFCTLAPGLLPIARQLTCKHAVAIDTYAPISPIFKSWHHRHQW